jgi:chromosome segregation ATPase
MGWAEMVGIILGSGTLGVVATRIVEARKAKLEHVREVRAADVSEATKTVQDLREMLQTERQRVQDQMAQLLTERKGHLDCLSRVVAVESKSNRMESQLEEIRQEHAKCPGKIERLETQVEELRESLLERYLHSSHPPAPPKLPPKPPGPRRG